MIVQIQQKKNETTYLEQNQQGQSVGFEQKKPYLFRTFKLFKV